MYICFNVVDIFKSGIWSGLGELQSDELKELARELPDLAIACRSKGTVKNYLTAFSRFKTWAKSFHEVTVLPAKPTHVALYLTHLSKISSSHSPISLGFYAISWAHRTAGFDDPTVHQLVKMVRESAVRNLGKGQNKKHPLKSSDIRAIVSKFANENSNLLELRTATLCILCFAGFLRFDEVSNLRYSDVEFEESYLRLFIEKSKTDICREGAWVYIAKTYNIACPFTVLDTYIKKASFKENSDKFLFRAISYFRTSNSHKLRPGNKPITYTCARELILKAFKDIGLNDKLFGTHSLRAGGATAAAENSVSDRFFKKHGRWKSERAKDGYVKEGIDQLLSVSLNLGL